ncbi:MAG: helix-turn-helix transcriptional regulator [Pseudomonadales bacterium]|nr:helix-turn-helix transcriptional regulator [Pseudomonadales bacterium]
MVQLRKRLAQFIRQKRGSMGQREFARKTGLAQSTIMRIENMDQNVTLDTLEHLCRVYHVDIEVLFPVVFTPRVYAERQFVTAGIHDSAAGDVEKAIKKANKKTADDKTTVGKTTAKPEKSFKKAR